MDQGPVDAAPSNDNDFGDHRRSYSPEHDRSASRARSAFRGESLRKQVTQKDHTNGEDELRYVKSGTRLRSGSDASDQSLGDPPMYPRVGATSEELEGEVCVDDDEHMREDPSEAWKIKDDDSRPHRMHKFILYETAARYWITGSDITDKFYRLMRIDRNTAPGQITLFEDETVYTRSQMEDNLNAIQEGNKPYGVRMKYTFWGLLGFIRFTEAYYMLIVTKRKQVAMIGGHYVYQIEGTELVPLTTGASSSFLRDRNPEEARFLNILNNLDLSKAFYFSYSYDITHSLQQNIIRQRQAMNEGRAVAAHEYNGMFVWNHYLLKPAVNALKHPYDWCVPIIHGFLDQAALDVFGRTVYVTIIGRRSRFFAGARFLKRGINDLGYVANDVETEQIVAEKLTTSFHAPGPKLFAGPTYTSYVHHRGSIPLYWTQDTGGVQPKPGIAINLFDPFYAPAALHFDHLFERYGCPIYVLNLVKQREKTHRESKLLWAFQDCLDYLNQSLPADKQIQYKAYDMARAAKTRNSDVIGGLEVIAKEIFEKTGFFHNGDGDLLEAQVQNGIARTNCIDCLDRTNAAQFVIGKHAFAHQLKALGVISTDDIAYDTDAVNLFTAMFHDHGDNIAMQYGGSHLVNTMATYRKLSHWHSSSRDMVESFKRYYHNSFLDSQRQEAYNLFLGNYIWAQGQPMLWDLATDYYLHHSDPKAWLERNRRDYIHWYTPEYLEPRIMPPKRFNPRIAEELRKRGVAAFDDYWRECYRPHVLSSLVKVYPLRMESTKRFLEGRVHGENKYDFSPFVRRADPKRFEVDEKKPQRKGVKILDPHEASQEPSPEPEATHRPPTANNNDELPVSIMRETAYRPEPETAREERPKSAPTTPATPEFKPADKAQMHLWTLNQFYNQSLNPHVSEEEENHYAFYVNHPLNLPLVITNDIPSDANIDYVEYVNKPSAIHTDFDDSEEGGDGGMPFARGVNEDDLRGYEEYLAMEGIGPNALTVDEGDFGKKRYKAYRQWLVRGKSLFKQSKVDPEYVQGS